MSASDIINGIYQLDSLSSDQVNNLSRLFGLLANYTQCVATDRFQPLPSEQDLELLTLQLYQNNTYIAGYGHT